jgi:PAS domain S-box-containing protein
MRESTIRPTGVERFFGEDEIIVTKTDRRGIVRYANETFLRISGYDECDIVGHPHNVIRHPDMPRCIFKLLWGAIEGGREIFAYVVNLAADGAHYWAFAHVTPSFAADGSIVGYHSNRRCPERAAVAQVQALYRDLAAEERAHSHPVRAVEASTAALDAVLAAHGRTYDEFVWDLTGAGASR